MRSSAPEVRLIVELLIDIAAECFRQEQKAYNYGQSCYDNRIP